MPRHSLILGLLPLKNLVKSWFQKSLTLIFSLDAALGDIYRSLGEYQQAIDFHRQGLAIDRKTGNRLGEGIALANIADTQIKLAQYDKASENLRTPLTILKEIRALKKFESLLKRLMLLR